jgi:hypothetical protein
VRAAEVLQAIQGSADVAEELYPSSDDHGDDKRVCAFVVGLAFRLQAHEPDLAAALRTILRTPNNPATEG